MSVLLPSLFLFYLRAHARPGETLLSLATLASHDSSMLTFS